MPALVSICMRSPTKKQTYPCNPFQYVRHASSSTLCRRPYNPSIKEIQISCFCVQRQMLDQEETRGPKDESQKIGAPTGETALEPSALRGFREDEGRGLCPTGAALHNKRGSAQNPLLHSYAQRG